MSGGCRVDCGCCVGTSERTPARIDNAPARPAIDYRAGTHSSFNASLLAGLRSADRPALRHLSTRDNSDLTIALLDALASSLDVLTFYQERLANEHYLRTAREQLSLHAMASLIGYEPSPGVAASTWLAFELQNLPPGTPGIDGPAVIPEGTKVQSVPGPDERPVTFETSARLEAHRELGDMKVRTDIPWAPHNGDTDLWLDGLATRLEPGDAFLIVGDERVADPGSERWEVRVVATVEPDNDRRRTRLTWATPLGHTSPHTQTPASAVRVYAFRKRAAMFGHNAPDPSLIDGPDSIIAGKWAGYDHNGTVIDLDQDYDGVTVGSWVALVSNDPTHGTPELPGYTELYRVEAVQRRSRTAFGLSGKITRITPDTTENYTVARYGLQATLALAATEEFATAPRTLTTPVAGRTLVLAGRRETLGPARPVLVAGTRQHVAVRAGVSGLVLQTGAAGGSVALHEGDVMALTALPARLLSGAEIALSADEFEAALDAGVWSLRFSIEDRDGTTGTVDAAGGQIKLVAAPEGALVVRQIAWIDDATDAVVLGRDDTTIRFRDPLGGVLARDTVRLNANTVEATHGERVRAALGDGDAGAADARYALREGPVTHVSAPTPSGRASTMSIRVNSLEWTEVGSLYAQPADARVYDLRIALDPTAAVSFGDGVEGARLPSGTANVVAEYRKGLGAEGNLAADRLTTLLQRPLGVTAVTNPVPADGGEDPELQARLRDNAPLTVLTLDRAVSAQDYENFARAFAGIDKAHALWIPAGPNRGVFVTVAGTAGAALPAGSKSIVSLIDSLHTYGDPLLAVTVTDHRAAAFAARVQILVDPAHDADSVLVGVRAALMTAFAFDSRSFGQTVSLSEVTAIAHEVSGVTAAHVAELHRAIPSEAGQRRPRLSAELPVVSLTGPPVPAELLALAEDQLVVELLP